MQYVSYYCFKNSVVLACDLAYDHKISIKFGAKSKKLNQISHKILVQFSV